MISLPTRALSVLAFSLLLALPVAGAAQADMSAASTAFRRGQALQLQEDHVGAADAFLLADSIAPSPEAIRGAITNLVAAGQSAQAASLAVEAQRRHPHDGKTHALADRVLRDLAPRLVRVKVSCAEPCTVSLANRAVVTDARTQVEFYVEPGTHDVQARFPQGVARSQLSIDKPGEIAERHFAPPVVPPPVVEEPKVEEPKPVVPEPKVEEPKPQVQAEKRGLRRVSPIYFYVGAGLTAGLAGVTVWSALDTVSANDKYEKAPTRGRYDTAKGKQDRTNIFIAATGTVALGTTLLGAIFTQFKKEREPSKPLTIETADLWVDHGAGFNVRGRW